MRMSVFVFTLTCSTFLLQPVGFSNDDAKPAKEEKPKEVTLTGVFEALQSAELSVGTEELTAFKIKKIVPHGTQVRKGQTLVWFETEDIDEKISTAEIALQLAKLDLQDAEFDFEQFQKTQQLNKAAAERTRRAAKQAHDNYVQVDRERSIGTADYNLKSYQASFDNAFEELKQLEQMYKEDELTEESEEIVLKRAKQAVDSAKFRLEGAKISAQRSLKQSIPRQTAQAEDTFARAEMAYLKSVHSLTVARQKQDIQMKQKRDKFKKQQDALKKMQTERSHLVITAPHDGIAYHGELTRGKLSDKPSTLKEGSAATKKQTLITVVNPTKLQIRAEVTETLLNKVDDGMTGFAKPAAKADLKLAVRVKSAAAIPYANNKFDCVIAIRKGRIDGIVPGMTCVVKLPEIAANAKAKAE